MDTDEFYLRPCKQLPSPTNDRQAPQIPMGQHLGAQSWSQSHLDQASRESTPSIGYDDADDEASEFEPGLSVDAAQYTIPESPEEIAARHLKDKEKEVGMVTPKQGPLRLLDLPVDILKLIFKEVTHTNDLANCAKVNSVLHSLVTPLIYSRFDIVWPETLSSADSARGVDALTYGLATLVMREDLFENVLYPGNTLSGVSCQSFTCPHCRSTSYLSKDACTTTQPRKSRRGNYFSQFVRKFSLGNGPPDWVQEYLVTKESGKMLGTLVALSVARMPNLESFIWDMPTGLLRDIWTALSSLGDYQHSKLERIWIRFHDNHAAMKDAGLLQPTVSAPTTQATPGHAISLPPIHQPSLTNPELYGVKKIIWIDHHVERPNFSTMPSLSSLTVLEIDEVQYLLELSILLVRSLHTLRELRLGMASTLNIPPSAQQSSETAPLFDGGVFSLLMSKIYNQTKPLGANDPETSKQEDTGAAGEKTGAQASTPKLDIAPPVMSTQTRVPSNTNQIHSGEEESEEDIDPLANQVEGVALDAIDPALYGKDTSALNDGKESMMKFLDGEDHSVVAENSVGRLAGPLQQVGRLNLEVLEIERLTKLSPSVLRKALDFTMLTSLTLLRCGGCSNLWDGLKKEFAPRITRHVMDHVPKADALSQQCLDQPKKISELRPSDMEYPLRLKRIHTDAVSSDLISFLKHTLAPNSLEWLFLQDTEAFLSPITLEAIYRGPLRRHRSSLTKLMIDSAYGPHQSRPRSSAARKWMLNRDVITFITSGKMRKLRELAVALEYKDWHFCLQRLPNIPHLRSLYVPNMSDHPYGNKFNVKDFAMSALDVVALRPEVELCYLAIKHKCFEISEIKRKDPPKRQASSSPTDGHSSDSETEDDDHHDGNDDDSDDGGGAGAANSAVDTPSGAMDSDAGSITSEEDGENEGGVKEWRKTKLKLREILFYDDKISIFKARHGRL